MKDAQGMWQHLRQLQVDRLATSTDFPEIKKNVQNLVKLPPPPPAHMRENQTEAEYNVMFKLIN